MTIHVIISFWAYLRPGESDKLKVRSLVAPHSSAGSHYSQWGLWLSATEDLTPGKTGLFDEAILLDNVKWLYPFLAVLTNGRDPNLSLWSHSTYAFLNELELATSMLGLHPLRICRYAWRHGGASEDLASGNRSRTEVKHRGRWVSDSSLARYGKTTRLLAEISKVPANTLAYGKYCMENFESLMHGSAQAPAPPCHN